MKHGAGEHWEQNRIRQAEKTGTDQQQKKRSYRSETPNVLPALLEVRPDVLASSFGFPDIDAHQQKRNDDGEITEAVDQKAVRFACECNDKAGYGRTDEPRSVDHHGIQRYRVCKVRTIPDHLDNERLSRRHIKRVH